MKNLTVFYSMTGNTETVAEEIRRIVGGDLLKLEEEKPRDASNIMAAAFSALIGQKSRLKPADLSLQGYDLVFLGTPVWAARCTPAVNTFLKKAGLQNKKIVLFITQADDKRPEKVINQLTKKAERRGGKVADSFYIQTKMGSVIEHESAAKAVFDWFKAHSV